MGRSVSIEYEGGPNSDVEAEVNQIIDEYEGENVGGGCCMFAPFMRDQQYYFKSGINAESAYHLIKKLCRNMRRRKVKIVMDVELSD